jgi:hypothetical protein
VRRCPGVHLVVVLVILPRETKVLGQEDVDP